MGFARGDLARRTALADNLAVPEPWGANDDPRVFSAIRDLRNEFRRLGITDEDGKGRLPDFLLDYEHLPPIKPTALGRAHTRNSSATRWDQNGNLVEDSSDTLRLQRDPKTQEPLGLLYEPQRTQKIGNPSDMTGGDWLASDVSVSQAGSAKGQTYYEVSEDNTSNDAHSLNDAAGRQTEGAPLAQSAIVKDNTRQYCFLSSKVNDDDSGVTDFPIAFFDLKNGVIGSINNDSRISVIKHKIKDLGGGWYRIKFVYKPNSAFASDGGIRIGLSENDKGSISYDGDGSSGIFVMHAQAEVSREVTTPILTGSATRGADEVGYRFAFPDRTTGVAFSIFQGRDVHKLGADPKPGITFGTTPIRDKSHGVLAWEGGILQTYNRFTSSWYTRTRNSDETPSVGLQKQIEDETIDRFKVRPAGFESSLLMRQIAIHRRPHTQAQKDTLRDKYLTQP